MVRLSCIGSSQVLIPQSNWKLWKRRTKSSAALPVNAGCFGGEADAIVAGVGSEVSRKGFREVGRCRKGFFDILD